MDNQPDPNAPPVTESLSARLVALLNLTPAKGATSVTDDEVLARVTALVTEAGAAATTATDLATAQADLEKVRGEYQVLFQREEDARKKVEEAAADEILAQYADRIATPEAKARIRALLLTDREAAMEILKGLAAPSAPKVEDQPPKPTHKVDGEADELTPEQKADEVERLIAELRREGKKGFTKYEEAHDEIRRRRPDLFA